MELQKDFGLVDSTEGDEDEELEQEKIAHQVEEGVSLRHYQARARAQRACSLRALVLLLADGTPTVGGGKTF